MKNLLSFVSKLSSKNQIVIPTKARELLRLKSGDEVALLPKDGVMMIIKKPSSFNKALFGVFGKSTGEKLQKNLSSQKAGW